MRLPFGCGEAGDVGNDGLGHVVLDPGGSALLGVTTDLADHHDQFSLIVRVEQRQHVDEVTSRYRIASDPDAGRLAQALLTQLVNDLVHERSRATHETDRSGLADLGRDDADVGLSGGDDAGAVRPDKRRPASVILVLRSRQAGPAFVPADVTDGPRHVHCGDALGDGDYGFDARVVGLENRIGRKGRWDEDHRGIRTGLGHRFGDGVEDRNALDIGPTLTGSHAGDEIGSVGLVA